MQKKALIIGIAGQDGSYLAAFLLANNYEVHGVTRDTIDTIWRHDYLQIAGKCQLHCIDLTDRTAVTNLLREVGADEIYHLASQSSVAVATGDPYPTLHFTTLSTLNVLEAIRQTAPHTKFFHASSSEIFAQNTDQALSLESPLAPTNPYGVAKAAAHLMVQQYRKQYNLFAVNGVLFPHESPLRHPAAFTKSLITQALAIKAGGTTPITLGQIANQRDFGYARDYVQASWQSLQVEAASDYVIGSGLQTAIADIAYYVVDKIGIPRTMIVSRKGTENEPVTTVYADPAATAATLNWRATTSIYETLDEMIAFETNPANQKYQQS